MRLKIAAWISKTLVGTAGLALVSAGVFAVELGIDNDPGWGRGRVLLVLAGVLFLALAAAIHFSAQLGRFLAWLHQKAAPWGQALSASAPLRAWRRLERAYHRLALIAYLDCHPRLSAGLAAGTGVLSVVAVYIWYLTAGTWTAWTPYSTYFDWLADAFLAGQVALLQTPPPELLALDNPYDYRLREGIHYIWDTTLYNGKYYLYWGPVPGLIAAGAKALLHRTIEDQHLTLLFCAGLVLVFALLLLWTRQKHFPNAPAWTLLPLVLLAGLSMPVLWLVNRPSVYEAAISGGQFFLFLGLYAGLRAAASDQRAPHWFLLAGLAWGAAINCRVSLAAAIAFFCAVLGWQILKRTPNRARALAAMACLALPLAAGAAGLGWYNWVRFGSLFETGHRYQLTGMALPADYHQITSLAYLIPSLYSYLVRPLMFQWHEFPFVFAPFIAETAWPWFIRLPEYYYYPEPVAGLLLAVPGVWLAGLPVLGWANRAWQWLRQEPTLSWQEPTLPRQEQALPRQEPALPGQEYTLPKQEQALLEPRIPGAPAWLWLLVSGGCLLLFLPLAVFISTSMRYLADVTPALVLLASLGLWWALGFWQRRPLLRNGLLLAMLVLVVISILLSLLVNFTNGDHRFSANNPDLYHAISDFFER